MESIENILKESKELLQKIHEKEDNVLQVTGNSIDVFRTKLLNFIENQLEPIRRTQDLLNLIDASIIRKLAYEEYDKNELIALRRELVNSMNSKTAVLLEPFKPTNGGSNTLITPPTEKDEDENNILKHIKPEERIALEKLYAILSLKEREKQKKLKNKDIIDTEIDNEED